MERKHAIIIIKNEKNKYLQYYDNRWESYLFPNCKINDKTDYDKIKEEIFGKYGIKINNIKAGVYYLKELKAPYGYIKNDEKIEFEILNSEVLSIEVVNNKIEMPNTNKSININYLVGVSALLVLSINLYEKKYKDN